MDPAVPVVRLRDMDSVFAESIRRPRLLAQLLGAFAGLALLLAAVGTYGVLSYMVTERRREIGIRMALGAARSSVIALVMKQGLQATIIGVIVGLAGAFGVTRLMASLLFGVQPTDAATIAAVIATISIVAGDRMLAARVACVAAGSERRAQNRLSIAILLTRSRADGAVRAPRTSSPRKSLYYPKLRNDIGAKRLPPRMDRQRG